MSSHFCSNIYKKGLEKLFWISCLHFDIELSLMLDVDFSGSINKASSSRAERLHFRVYWKGTNSLGLFVGFTQAFINHSLLFAKIEWYGIRGLPLQLMKSCWNNRRQFVSTNCIKSRENKIVSIVPQGSILGPVLFNLYINGIVCICQQVNFMIYADDSSVFVCSSFCT